MPNDASRLGPAPAWRDAVPPLTGILVASAVAALAIAIEAIVLLGPSTPGVVLDWFPLVAAAATFLLAIRGAGPLRGVWLACSITLLALFPALDPDPMRWMYAAPLVAIGMTLGLRLAPATRVVAAVPALAGLLGVFEILPATTATTVLAIAAVGACLLAVWFLIPHASGWRRVPYLALLAVALAIPLAFGAVLAGSLVTDGIARPPQGAEGWAGGPGALALAGAAIAIALPIALVMLWSNASAQAFLLPSRPLPHTPRPRAHDPFETGEQA